MHKFLFPLLFSCTPYLGAQTIYFVHQNASGGQQTGLSWADAFTDLQAALAAAQYGDEIWIAAGTYLPTPSNDRSVSFQLKNGVKMYGGFNGTENSPDQRNWTQHITRLSGNIGDPALATDNSWHVAVGRGLDENTLLDGLVISDGYSLGPTVNFSDSYGAGLFLTGSAGLFNARPVIRHCRFEHNAAGYIGGGMYIGYIDPDDPLQQQNLVNPQITYCVFANNYAWLSGAGFCKSGPSGWPDSFLLREVAFQKNYAYSGNGGGIYFEYAGASIISLEKVLLDSNVTLGGNGGGFSLPLIAPGGGDVQLRLDSCVFKKNIAPEGGGFFSDGSAIVHPAVTLNLTIHDSFFEENEARNATGGAFTVITDYDDQVNASITGCTFNRNYANSYFASAILSYGQSEINARVENCVFTNNVFKSNPEVYMAGFSAGGHRVNTVINNCLFANNGAGVFAGGFNVSQVLTKVTNCTFFKNGLQQPLGLRWHNAYDEPGSPYFNRMLFYNCIHWEPGAHLADNNNMSTLNSTGFFFDYCMISPSALNTTWGWHEIVGDSMIYDFYPAFKDTMALDFRLESCSPMVNRGYDAAVQEAGLASDLDGAPRIRFGRADIGAYESQDACIMMSDGETPALAQRAAIGLMPNLLSPGASFRLHYPEAKMPSWRWLIRDMTGRVLAAGQEQEVFTAPAETGCYVFEFFAPGTIRQLRLMVQ